ncbi:MAG TPA: hypothetical protein VLK34_02295 [Nocardioidaceae bacterium]|nr:hypothetical protein [Nocardioidaceae bacterium]
MTPEPVGSLAEEAARLVSALSSIHPGGHADTDDAADTDDPTDTADAADAGEAHADHDPLSPECRYCPFCALARAARSMTPEVREHLASAAGSLLLAVRGILDDAVARSSEAGGSSGDNRVEKIDLAED